jgi:hypothetical protein
MNESSSYRLYAHENTLYFTSVHNFDPVLSTEFSKILDGAIRDSIVNFIKGVLGTFSSEMNL